MTRSSVSLCTATISPPSITSVISVLSFADCFLGSPGFLLCFRILFTNSTRNLRTFVSYYKKYLKNYPVYLCTIEMDVKYALILWQGKNCRQFGVLFTPVTYWSVCSSSRRGGDGVKGVEGKRYFIPLQVSRYKSTYYMIIWFKIQVIINPLQ